MADVWRIFVVEGEESLNQSIVHSLRMDGYIVQGILNGADAIRTLWSEEYDAVICGLKAPGVGGLELLQWLRIYRPNVRLILVGGDDPSITRVQALESGASGYLEKPLDMRLLKEELRHLFQQTGFSADLDSFDLLDVIQMITMSRSKIALLVNAGLEERGLLRFQNGELVWAEYGTLRGEEAFFALAAHKNGSVQQQPWSEVLMPNVKLPLSRLIFQALQYRSKYANAQPDVVQPVYETNNAVTDLLVGEEDDTPFVVETPSAPMLPTFESSPSMLSQETTANGISVEWWQQTSKHKTQSSNVGGNVTMPIKRFPAGSVPLTPRLPLEERELANSTETAPRPATPQPRPDASVKLPSWLTDQPTASNVPSVSSARPTVPFAHPMQVPVTPKLDTTLPEWPSQSLPAFKSSSAVWQGVSQPLPTPQIEASPQEGLSDLTEVYRAPLSTWQTPGVSSSYRGSSQTSQPRIVGDVQRYVAEPGSYGLRDAQDNGLVSYVHPLTKRSYHYAGLISALQTLGYSIKGFIASAVLALDGQLMAQVTIDEQDFSIICKHFGTVIQNVLLLLDQGALGEYEETIITSSDRSILLRLVGDEKKTLHVLITGRETSSADSLEIMTNVEGAISAALR